MVNYKDLGITSQTFKDYVAFGYGEFKVSNSQIVNFGILNADGTLNEAETQKVMDMMGTKALRIIKRSLDTNKLLTIFSFDYFNVDYQAAIVEVVLDQIEGMITDGPFEVKNGSSYSGQGADVQTDISGFLLSQDRLYKATEDTWYEASLDEVNVAVDEDGNYILTNETLGNVFNFKFQSGQSVGSVILTGSGMEILTADEINNVLNAKIVSNKEFVGTYEASNAQDVRDLDTNFKGAGLVLTNGNTFQQATAKIGQAIKVTVPSVPTFKPEQYEWDGNVLGAITYNNLQDAEFAALATRVKDNEDNKKDKSEFDTQLDIDVATGNGSTTEKLIGILKPLVSKETLDYFINGLDERATDLESLTSSLENLVTQLFERDTHNLKKENTVTVTSTGVMDETTESALLPTREDVRSFVKIIETALAGGQRTLNMTQLEAADELIRQRLGALEKEAAESRKVFDTGEIVNGVEQPKKNYVQFPALVDGTVIDLKQIPATSMDGGIAYISEDFHINPTTGNGPEIQIVVWGDESKPTDDLTLPLETAPEADWEGSQSFTTIQAGRTWVHLGTSHWSAQFKISIDGIVSMKDFKILDDPSGTPYPVKRLLLVQSSLDITQGTTNPGYDKNEADTRFASKSVETTKQDATSQALQTVAKNIVDAINELKGLSDNHEGVLAQLGDKKLSDGENLLDTAEVIATEKHVDAQVKVLDTAYKAANAAQDLLTVKKSELVEIVIPRHVLTSSRNFGTSSKTHTSDISYINDLGNADPTYKPKRIIGFGFTASTGLEQSWHYNDTVATTFLKGNVVKNTHVLNLSSEQFTWDFTFGEGLDYSSVTIEYEKVIPEVKFKALPSTYTTK